MGRGWDLTLAVGAVCSLGKSPACCDWGGRDQSSVDARYDGVARTESVTRAACLVFLKS